MGSASVLSPYYMQAATLLLRIGRPVFKVAREMGGCNPSDEGPEKFAEIAFVHWLSIRHAVSEFTRNQHTRLAPHDGARVMAALGFAHGLVHADTNTVVRWPDDCPCPVARTMRELAEVLRNAGSMQPSLPFDTVAGRACGVFDRFSGVVQ
jgi:hypothetical protein